MSNLYVDLVQVGISLLLLIGIGFVLQKFHILRAKDFACTKKLCSKIGLPFLMFSTFLSKPIEYVSWWPLIITGIANLCMHVLLLSSFLIWRKNGLEHFVSLQISSCYANFVIIGLPIFTSIWGEEYAQVPSICPLYHYFFVVPLFLLLTNILKIRKANSKDENFKYKLTLRDVGKAFWDSIRSPLLIGAACGLIWSATTLKTPTFLKKLSKTIGDYVVVFSLLSIGSFIESNSLCACKWYELVACVSLRFIISPILGICFCILFKIEGMLGKQISILAAMPISAISFIIAGNAGYGANIASSVAFWTAIFVVPAIIFWFWIMDVFHLFE